MRRTIAVTVLAALSVFTAACDYATEPVPTQEPSPSVSSTATPTAKISIEYRLNASKPNPNGDYYSEPDQKFTDKVNEIFAQYAHPQNDIFENVLGLYQYVSQNITYKETGASDTAGALLNAEANQTGFTRTFQYLLNQIGVETLIVTANDGSQNWVMAELPDGFYHFDAGEEARQSAGQSLQYFAMNDEKRWDGGKFDGWYVGTEQDKKEPPKNDKQTYTFMQNIKAGYGVDFENNYLYFADVAQDNVLVKYNYQSGLEEALYGKRAGSMVYFRKFLYYSDLDQRNQLFKMDVTTGQIELLDSVFVTRMMIKDGNLIYFDDVSSSEKGIKLS